MKALILNSGVGSRMGDLTKTHPKCMSLIGNGYTILSWQLKLLSDCNIRDVVITTGAFADMTISHALSHRENMNISFVNNPIYDETNYIYSMYLAKDFLQDDDIIYLHGDLVLEKSVLVDLIETKDSVIAVDSSLSLPDKDFKALIKDDKISAIGVEFMTSESVVCQPLYKLNKEDFGLWLKEIEGFCLKGNTKVYAENALNKITEYANLFKLELKGRLCREIDNLEDLKVVSKKFIEIGE